MALLALVAWRIYARFKRMVGKQRLSKPRVWLQLMLFPALVLAVAFVTFSNPMALVWLAVGLAAGAGLGTYGLRTTAFQPEAQDLYYTPNSHLGVILSLLLVLRLAYRLVEIYALRSSPDLGGHEFLRSPLTLALFGLLAGYFITYAIGLWRWSVRVLRTQSQK